MMSDVAKFFAEVRNNVEALGKDHSLRELSYKWLREAIRYKYTYNFTWMGLPIIQLPQDNMAMQEIVWRVKPDLIIETGIAHGGSLVFYASLLELIGGDGKVLGVDIDIRQHNRIQIERHPMFKRIEMVEGSSIDESIVREVRNFVKGKKRILVVLDSHHTHTHVLKELELYSPFVTKGSYLVVFDTGIEDMPKGFFADRPWGKGNNPKTAVWDFLKGNDRFEIDKEIEHKLLITASPDGYLRCLKD